MVLCTAVKKAISFSIKIKIPMITYYVNPLYLHLLRIYIFDETMGMPSNFITNVNRSDLMSGYTGSYLAKLDLTHNSLNKTHFQNADNQNLFEITYNESVINRGSIVVFGNAAPMYDGYILINCMTDNEQLNYAGNRRLKVGIEYMQGIDEHPNDDDNVYAKEISVDFQLIDLPLELNAVNDAELTI